MPRQTGSVNAVFLDLATVDRGDLDLSPLHNAVDAFESWPVTAADDIAPRIRDADVVIINKTRLDAGTFKAAQPGLVCLAATGTDNVDLAAARELGIGVANISDYCTDSVAQHAFALILALTVRLIDYRDRVRAGAWTQSETFAVLDFPIRELAGKALAIVGHGTLGNAVAERARAFGMRVIVAERKGQAPRPGRIPFERALAEADVISLHAPLTSETRSLIDTHALSLMKHDALLINTARGGLIDEAALARTLANREIGGAGLDVLSSEPPAADNPLLDPALGNCIITPHIAWAALEARQRAIAEIAANITAWRASERRNRVD